MARLPSGYTELEWIESGDIHCCINTGAIPPKNVKIILKLSPTEIPSANTYFAGTGASTNDSRFNLRLDTNNKYSSLLSNSSGSAVSGGQLDANINQVKELTWELSYDNQTSKLSDGTTTVDKTYTPNVSGFTKEYRLFNYNTDTNSGLKGLRIYKFQMYDLSSGDELIDLVPAKNSSNVIGMYDLVTDTFYTNAGTGNFIAGPEIIIPQVVIHGSIGTKKAIAPYSPYEWLEYVESTGTQYIDTGITPHLANDTQVYTDLAPSQSSYSSKGFGSNNNLNVYISSDTTHWRANGQQSTISIVQNKKTSFHFYFYADGKRGTSIDGVEINKGSVNEANYNFLLGACGGVASASGFAAKWYGCKIYQNNVVTIDFTPARRKSDGVVGMYDKVNDVFYTNSGTGNFIAGPIKVVKTVISIDADEFIHAYVNNDYEDNPFIINFSDGSSRDIGPYLNSVECIAWHEKSEDVSRDADVDICDNIKLFYGLLTPLNTITFNAYTPKMEGSIYFIRTWDEFPYDFDPDTYPIKFFFGNNITNRLNIDFRDVYHFEYSGGGYAYEGQLWIIFYQEENTVVPLAAMPSTMCGV